jgi:hypothetical protein
MPLTTSDNAYQPGVGGTGQSKPLCWDCGKPDKVMTVHPGYGYSLCRACTGKAGVKTAPIEVVGEEEEPKSDPLAPEEVAGDDG